MSPSSRRFLSLILAAAGILAASTILASTASAAKTVHFRGTAYEFNNVKTMLAGGVVKVAEYPNLQATIASDGTYDIAVPDKKKVTLYAVATGYHSVYTQTFTTDGVALDHVNLQTPTEGIYKALASIINVPLDANGLPVQCAIVTTFSTKNVRDLDYQGFIGYGAHGVAGATASGTPAMPAPTYFNEHVIPDAAQKESSKDGGIVWANVPTGVYRIKASSPTTRFASFDASCVPGRVVNANPPWGLHELAANNPVKVKATWSRKGKVATLRRVSFTTVPADSSIVVGSLKPITPTSTTVDLKPKAVTARAGQTFEISVRSHALNGSVFQWKVPASGAPKSTTSCLPLGDNKPVKRCP